MSDAAPTPPSSRGLFVSWKTLAQVVAGAVATAAAGVTLYDWVQKPRAELHVEATTAEDVLLAPSLAEALTLRAQVRGDTSHPPQPTLAGTVGRWHLVARNTGGRRLREVPLAVPRATYVCIQRPPQPVRCGPPAATRDLGTLDPGEVVTADVWTSHGYSPAIASREDEPRLTHSEGIGVLEVLTPYSRAATERLHMATEFGRFLVFVVAAVVLSLAVTVVGNRLFARTRAPRV